MKLLFLAVMCLLLFGCNKTTEQLQDEHTYFLECLDHVNKIEPEVDKHFIIDCYNVAQRLSNKVLWRDL